MNYKAVIFDLDGTLIDSLADISAAANNVLEDLGYERHPMEAFRQFVGNGVRVLFEQSLPADSVSTTLLDECLLGFDAHYAQLWNETSNPYDGIPELLDALEQRSIAISVLSNKPHEFTRQCVETLLRPWNFWPVRGQRDDTPRKPDPAGLLQIIDELNLTPHDCMYVGDSNVDIETARRANVLAVGVAWGFRPVDELRESGADAIIGTPSELLSLLDSR